LFLTLNPGDHIIFSKEVYGGTYRILENVFKKYGLFYDFVDFSDNIQVKKLIRNSTKYFFVESVSNPSLHVIDFEKLQTLSKATGIPYIVDGTFLPPNAIQYFEHGAETVLYSLSKYVAGHNDALGGAIVTKNKILHANLQALQRSVGAILSPD
jgi:cystathionine beta-lyase/cystathionine gamma-synthase